MPIKKNDSAILRKNRVPYEIIPRDVAQSIKNPIALAIWVYLLTKPENWVVRKKEIMEHFSIGQDRYAAAMQVLNEMGLIVSASVQDPETGRLQGRILWVNGFTEVPENPYVGKPRMSGNPECRENTTLKETENELKKQRESAVSFDEFWFAWPRKANKKKAKSAWNQLSVVKQRLAMKDFPARYAGTEKRFIPLPTTYIHGERWEDEKDNDCPQYKEVGI